MEYYYHGVWRLDIGLGNPNKTAALFASLMVAVWILIYLHKDGFWLSLSVFFGIGLALIHTFSRGGEIALLIGLLPIIVHHRLTWTIPKIGCVTTVIIVLSCYAIVLGDGERLTHSLTESDKSIENRIELWEAAPRMMVDAPLGWGLGKAGQVYMDWYQPFGHKGVYRTLVNSHLTWLVEIGWPMRYIYILGWLCVLLVSFPGRDSGHLTIALGVWLAFGCSSLFSSVAESFILWIVPLISLIFTVYYRQNMGKWIPCYRWLIAACLALVATLVVFLVGRSNSIVHGSPGTVILGVGKPKVWIVPNDKIMGHGFARSIRGYSMSTKAIAKPLGIAEDVTCLPINSHETVILAGEVKNLGFLRKEIPSDMEIILINPSFFPADVFGSDNYSGRTVVLFGEFSQSPSILAWANFCPVRRIPGYGDFWPKWTDTTLALLGNINE